MRNELEAYTRDLAAEYGVSNSFLNEESTEALSQIRSVEDAEQMLDEKKAEAEEALKSLTGDTLNKIKDNLKLPGF